MVIKWKVTDCLGVWGVGTLVVRKWQFPHSNGIISMEWFVFGPTKERGHCVSPRCTFLHIYSWNSVNILVLVLITVNCVNASVCSSCGAFFANNSLVPNWLRVRSSSFYNWSFCWLRELLEVLEWLFERTWILAGLKIWKCMLCRRPEELWSVLFAGHVKTTRPRPAKLWLKNRHMSTYCLGGAQRSKGFCRLRTCYS